MGQDPILQDAIYFGFNSVRLDNPFFSIISPDLIRHTYKWVSPLPNILGKNKIIIKIY
ncbi:hypothetical protein MB9_1206 [Methanobacterium formicicum]|uniref:Uncharacterized protein n=1 Tax=Methanobacterium formicicum TaxID=2162 RepID=A0A0S4FP74_METFO|nr:hypothetical protein MB9_1206 [Methanobacterium formicicum]